MRSKRQPPTEQQVTDAFRALANEHAREREPLDKQRAWYALQHVSRVPRKRPWVARLGWALALAVFALGIAVGAPAWQAWTMLRYQAHGLTTESGNLRAHEEAADLQFSDGSRVDVHPHAVLSVEVIGKRAALTRLVEGRLHVAVHHEPDTNYRFLAGPYEVQVVGTEFDLEWREQAEGLTLVMQSGEVRVLGEGDARRVSAGQRLSLPSRRAAPREAASAAPAPTAPAPTAPAPTAPAPTAPAPTAPEPPLSLIAAPAHLAGVTKVEPLVGKPSAVAAPPNATDWRTLLDSGQFSAIVRDAEARGNERVLAAASAGDLKVLALAARYTGRSALSLRAWQALRERYPADARTQGTAFFLGRGYEEQGDNTQALNWLARYLAESPSGSYASEALGRRLLLLSKSGQKAEATTLAREYLARYPRGAYAKAARLVVQPE